VNKIAFTVFVIIFPFKKALANDAFTIDGPCYSWQEEENAYGLLQKTKSFYSFVNPEEHGCPVLTVGIYDTLFIANSFVFDPATKIDSLFYATVMEIKKLPTHGWIDYATHEWLEPDLENCKTITVPQSLFALFNKKERDSLHSMFAKNRALSVTDSLLALYTGITREHDFPPIDVIACSIRASIEPEPSGEHALLLNSTRYRMVKLSNNHYVLRKGK
jgi:hypothetical protein